MFGEERKVALDGLLSELTNKHINEKDELRAKQEQQIKDLQSKEIQYPSYRFVNEIPWGRRKG